MEKVQLTCENLLKIYGKDVVARWKAIENIENVLRIYGKDDDNPLKSQWKYYWKRIENLGKALEKCIAFVQFLNF